MRGLRQEQDAVVNEIVKAAIEGGKPHAIFKSWYSLVPSNQSLFKIWILVILLAATLGGWILVSFQTFLRGADFN